MTLKNKIGILLIPKLPFNRHVFNHLRLELNAFYVRNILSLNPFYRIKLAKIKSKINLLANIGCGPFGKEQWVNLDLFPHPNLTIRYDTRWRLPFTNESCDGIHVEHFLEHLNPKDEIPVFLKECKRCLNKNGVLRIIVPNIELYIRAYLEEGWQQINEIKCGGDKPEMVFKTKIEALNHVFLQEWEHYGGFDSEYLNNVLDNNGFKNIKKQEWRVGDFPGGCIDRELHKNYSLYFEAKSN